MSGKRIITVDKVTLHVPRGADANAVLQEVSHAIAQGAVRSTQVMRVSTPPALRGEGPQALAQRIGRATAARITSGEGT